LYTPGRLYFGSPIVNLVLIKLEGEGLLWSPLLDGQGPLKAPDFTVEELILSCNVVQTLLKLLDVFTALILYLTAYNCFELELIVTGED
jgi:hypothetical protein